jgi:CBS domain-containing protein
MPPRVSSYMSSPLVTVNVKDTLAHARRLMLRHGVSRLPVIDEDDRLYGIITIADIAEVIAGKFVSRGLDEILVKEVCTPDPITIEPTKSIKSAAQIMLKHRIGGLPVVDYMGSLLGIITRTDLVRAYAERYKEEFKVRDFMRTEFVKARRDHSLHYIAKLLALDPAGKVIVEEDGRPVGVIAKRDLAFLTPIFLPKGSKRKRLYKIKELNPMKGRIVSSRIYLIPVAEDIMTPNPITITPDEDLAKAAEIMTKEGIGVLPVVDENGRLQGIISKIEVLKAITRA